MTERRIATERSNSERDQEIVRRYFEPGMSLQKVGDEHGLSRERVRQILNAQGVSERHVRTAWLPACRWCGLAIEEKRGQRASYHDACRLLAAEARREARRQKMIGQVQEFVRVHGRTPGGADFNPSAHNLSPERKQEALDCRAKSPLPFVSQVQDLFGSARALIAAADVPPPEFGGAASKAGRERRGEA